MILLLFSTILHQLCIYINKTLNIHKWLNKKTIYPNNKTCVQYKTKTASLGIRTLQSTFQQVYYESVAHWNLKYKFCTQLSQLISFIKMYYQIYLFTLHQLLWKMTVGVLRLRLVIGIGYLEYKCING